MAIYHCSIKIISRGKGKSAVGAAAYRSGEKITNTYDGETHDYTKKGGVVHTEILLPDHAPMEFADRSILWNAVERIEKNKNSQLAREIELALPIELPTGKNISLVREYCRRHFVSAGMIADICIHDKRDGNPHAHIMLTLRPIEPNGSWGAKSRKEYILDGNGERIRLKSGAFKTRKIYTADWNDQTRAEEWRAGWADAVNDALERENLSLRVDHRSYERQGLEQIPTVHIGVSASQMERRGIVTERGNRNREIDNINKEMRQVRARITKVKNWLYAQPLTDAPTLTDMMSGMMGGQELKKHWQKLSDLKNAAKVLIFLQENGVHDMNQLAGKVTEIHNHFYDVAKKIKAAERRFGTLTEHLERYEIYQQNKAVYQKYKQLDPKKREAFYDKHSEKIHLYESARDYFAGVMNGRTTLPVKEWKDEAVKLTAEKYELCEKFYRLKDEIKSVEALKREALKIMSAGTPEQDRKTDRTRDTAR